MSKPLDVPYATTVRVRDACLCLHVQRAARSLARRFDAALKPVGLTNGQFSMMMALNRPELPTMGQVAELLAMNRTTLTANLKPLERRGLVEVTPHADDARRRLIRLTPEGRSLLAAAVPLWNEAEAESERLVGSDVDRLRVALKTLS